MIRRRLIRRLEPVDPGDFVLCFTRQVDESRNAEAYGWNHLHEDQDESMARRVQRKLAHPDRRQNGPISLSRTSLWMSGRRMIWPRSPTENRTLTRPGTVCVSDEPPKEVLIPSEAMSRDLSRSELSDQLIRTASIYMAATTEKQGAPDGLSMKLPRVHGKSRPITQRLADRQVLSTPCQLSGLDLQVRAKQVFPRGRSRYPCHSIAGGGPRTRGAATAGATLPARSRLNPSWSVRQAARSGPEGFPHRWRQ